MQDPRLNYNLALVYAATRQFVDAERQLDLVLVQNTDDVRALNVRGELREAAGRKKEALEDYRRAAGTQSNDPAWEPVIARARANRDRLAATAASEPPPLAGSVTAALADPPTLGDVLTAPRRVALVIGNAAYRHAGELANPINDATDVAAVLKGLGFEVIRGLDLDKASMDRQIRDFAQTLVGASAAVFFFAGHGLQVGGVNYLVPVDAELSTAAALDFEMVRLDILQRTMEREAKTNILFLDACRNNPLARNLARAMGTRSGDVGRGLAAAESGVGTLISFSTQPGNVASDGHGRNSPFAGAIIRHIADTKEDVSAVLIEVRNDVMRQTEGKQVPWEHSALTGRFYFNAAGRAQ